MNPDSQRHWLSTKRYQIIIYGLIQLIAHSIFHYKYYFLLFAAYTGVLVFLLTITPFEDRQFRNYLFRSFAIYLGAMFFVFIFYPLLSLDFSKNLSDNFGSIAGAIPRVFGVISSYLILSFIPLSITSSLIAYLLDGRQTN